MELLLRILAAAVVYGGLLGIIILAVKIRENRNKITSIMEASYSILEVLVPKNNEKGPLAAENLYASIHGIYNVVSRVQEKISLEIISKEQAIKFYIYTPTHLKEFIEGQVYAQYPTVEIKTVDDYTTKMEGKNFAGCELVLNKNEVFPIKTFESFEVDPLAGITGVLSKTAIGEQIWIQIIISPVPDIWQSRGINYISAIRQGFTPDSKFGSSVLKGVVSLAGDVAKTVTNRTQEEVKKQTEMKLSGPEEIALKGIETKVAKLGFQTKIRVISVSEDEITAKSKTTGVVSSFKQFNMTNLNGFSSTVITSEYWILDLYQKRVLGERSYILNIEELASIYHLPSESVATPSISWAGSKKGEPPSNLPIEDVIDQKELTMFAKANFRHFDHKFGMKINDRRLHFYAIGKTGTGKSTMLENMIIDDIQEGRGVAVVDPHGDLVDHILEYIPNERIKDVVYFSPSDRTHPIGFNILENVDPDLKSIVASGVVGIFKKIFGDSWGPRLEYILRNAVLSLLDYPDATMLGITRLFVDNKFRNDVVAHIQDPVIKYFWTSEFEKYDQKFRTEAVAPIQNKVGQFLSSTTIRNIVGQPKSTINLRDIMDNKKILLIDLSIGKIGEDMAALLGAMMITKIQLAAMERANVKEEERQDFYLYVDEFQNFATESFATILSEARKYHLNLIMTNQYIAQMPEIVQSAVFGNVGTIVSFRVGAQDSTLLAKEFEPVFEANDLVNLDNYTIYIKMAIDGVTSPGFSATTLEPYNKSTDNRAEIIEHSRRMYSKSREEVELGVLRSVEQQIESSSDDPTRYPKDMGNGFVKLKDPKTGNTFYTTKENAYFDEGEMKDKKDKKPDDDNRKSGGEHKGENDNIKTESDDGKLGILKKRISNKENSNVTQGIKTGESIDKNKSSELVLKKEDDSIVAKRNEDSEIEEYKKLDDLTTIDL